MRSLAPPALVAVVRALLLSLPTISGPRVSEHYANFLDAAVNATLKNDEPVTDKVTTHAYETMYAQFLLPLRDRMARMGKQLKILEIGLGCDMRLGRPGASALLWSRLLPNAERWYAELDGACAKRLGLEHVLVGDQSHPLVLERWVNRSGGGFHVIIDDGGHLNYQIIASLKALWVWALEPGGLYFIEDLHVSRARPMEDDFTVNDMLQSWSEQLYSHRVTWPHAVTPINQYAHDVAAQHRVPDDLEFVFAQRGAAVLGKLSPASLKVQRLHRELPDDGGGPLGDLPKRRQIAMKIAAAYRNEVAGTNSSVKARLRPWPSNQVAGTNFSARPRLRPSLRLAASGNSPGSGKVRGSGKSLGSGKSSASATGPGSTYVYTSGKGPGSGKNSASGKSPSLWNSIFGRRLEPKSTISFSVNWKTPPNNWKIPPNQLAKPAARQVNTSAVRPMKAKRSRAHEWWKASKKKAASKPPDVDTARYREWWRRHHFCVMLTTTITPGVDLRKDAWARQQQLNATERELLYKSTLRHWLQEYPFLPIILVENSRADLRGLKAAAAGAFPHGGFSRRPGAVEFLSIGPSKDCGGAEIGCHEASTIFRAVAQSGLVRHTDNPLKLTALEQYRAWYKEELAGKHKCTHVIKVTGRYVPAEPTFHQIVRRSCGPDWTMMMQNTTWGSFGYPPTWKGTQILGFRASITTQLFGWSRFGLMCQECHANEFADMVRAKSRRVITHIATHGHQNQAHFSLGMAKAAKDAVCQLPPIRVHKVREGSTGMPREWL